MYGYASGYAYQCLLCIDQYNRITAWILKYGVAASIQVPTKCNPTELYSCDAVGHGEVM